MDIDISSLSFGETKIPITAFCTKDYMKKKNAVDDEGKRPTKVIKHKIQLEPLIKENEKSGEKNNYVKIDGNIFKYEGNALKIIFDDNLDKWFRGSDICKILKYKYPGKAIRLNVEKENVQSLQDLKKHSKNIHDVLLKNDMRKKDMIFINQKGLFQLLLNSKMEGADKFREWVTEDILPTIDKTGKYNMHDDVDINVPTSFYDNNYIYTFDGKRCVYIGYVGKIGLEYYYKYGITSDIYRRDNEELSRDIAGFKITYVRECQDNDKVETMLKKELTLKGVMRSMKFNGKTYTELFVTNNNVTLEGTKALVDRLIDTHDEKYEDTSSDRYKYLIECEKTKQITTIEATKLAVEKNVKIVAFQRIFDNSENKNKYDIKDFLKIFE
jgi:prophage antirepressor-like protein